MCAAIHNNQNWSNANTTVHFNEEENVSVVRLHGNKIAEVTDDTDDNLRWWLSVYYNKV